jgi:DNA-binding PadR family transcriptional regulator
MTPQAKRVLAAFLKEPDDPDTELYCRGLSEELGLKPGTVQPILKRFERAGWLTSRWEKVRRNRPKRPLRLYYSLTSDGWAVAREEAAIERSNIKRRRAS